MRSAQTSQSVLTKKIAIIINAIFMFIKLTTMAKKKSATKKAASKKTFLQKVGDKASNIKDDLVAGKDHLVEIAEDAFDAVKSGIKHITAKKKTAKKAAKKTAKKTVKKAAPKKAKVAAKKTAKAAPKKAAKAVSKKSIKRATPKKAAKKK